jgi:transposase
MAISYIGADVDSKMTNLAVDRNGRIVQEMCVPTTIPSLTAALQTIPRPRHLTFEEGPMAQWLARNLRPCVDELVVCNPRHNALLKEGDKDDVIDARKLATLNRAGLLQGVYHSDNDQHIVLKQWVGLYCDRVQNAVRQVNKVKALCRGHGLRAPGGIVRNASRRKKWLTELGDHPAAAQLDMLLSGLDLAGLQVEDCRRKMASLAKSYPIIEYWQELPGVGPIRATTLYAYVDTPWRWSNNPHKLWKYCGVGLEHAGSGKDKHGRIKLGRLQLAWQVNRRLKNVVMGAAISAIRQEDNLFAEQYERLVHHGLTQGNALHTVARKMLTVMWGMWKTNSRFNADLAQSRERAAETHPKKKQRGSR